MPAVSEVRIGLLADMMRDVELDEKEQRYYKRMMSSYPAFSKWSQSEDLAFLTLIKAFKYELSRQPRRQIIQRIIQLYNAKLTRFNWEAAMKMVGT